MDPDDGRRGFVSSYWFWFIAAGIPATFVERADASKWIVLLTWFVVFAGGTAATWWLIDRVNPRE